MNYKGKNVVVTGATGFIGTYLTAVLRQEGATVNCPDGDVRDKSTFSRYIDHRTDYLFHFAAPSSQILFKRQPYHSAEVTLKGFMNALEVTQQHGVKLVYPSTGLLSSDQVNEYARCKKVCEEMAAGTDALGIRIFATYGPGEGHKKDYASVPYLFARDMVAGRQPVIYGKGDQSRDFIYITDCVSAILEIAERCPNPTIDLGWGASAIFNEIVSVINKILGTDIKPIYLEKPDGYVDDTFSSMDAHHYYKPKVALIEGLTHTIKQDLLK